MPWLSILMALLSFLGTLKKDKSNVGQAALVGAAAGLGTYYVSHETEWGRSNLGSLDGVVTGTVSAAPDAVTTYDGPAVKATVPVAPASATTTAGSVEVGGSTGGVWQAIADNIVPVASGVAVGATLSSSTSKWLPWVIGGVVLLLVLK